MYKKKFTFYVIMIINLIAYPIYSYADRNYQQQQSCPQSARCGTNLSEEISYDIISNYIPQPKRIGSGRLSFLFWDVYDAYLYSTQNNFDHEQTSALSIKYLVDISGEEIADRSAEEIRNLGFNHEIKLATWHSQMKEIFPNISEGTTLTAIYIPNQEVRFYKEGDRLGVVQDKEFGYWFFNIWLSENTSQPELRRQLLRL